MFSFSVSFKTLVVRAVPLTVYPRHKELQLDTLPDPD